MASVVGQQTPFFFGASEQLQNGGGRPHRLAGLRSAPLKPVPSPTAEATPEKPRGDCYYTPSVQNTFIHFKLGMDGEAVGAPALRRCATDPEAIMKAAFLVSSSATDDAQPLKPISDSSTVVSGNETTDSEAGANAEGLRDSFASSSSDTVDTAKALNDFEIYETFTPGPSWSMGAVGHDAGNCKPCAWNWKPSGCSKGRSCEFCHLCEEGELKRQKKERQARLRAKKAERRFKSSAISAPESPASAPRRC